MVIDRFLKVNGWVINMEHERGVYLGNQYLDCYRYQYVDGHWEQHRNKK